MSELTRLENDIEQLQQRLNRKLAAREAMLASIEAANTKRPPGIPATWKPYFTGEDAKNIRIHAWFDPEHFGDFFGSAQ